jgi:hypothetical protein
MEQIIHFVLFAKIEYGGAEGLGCKVGVSVAAVSVVMLKICRTR